MNEGLLEFARKRNLIIETPRIMFEKMIQSIDNSRIVDENSTLYFCEGKILFDVNPNNRKIHCSYPNVWVKFKERYNLSHIEIETTINRVLSDLDMNLTVFTDSDS